MGMSVGNKQGGVQSEINVTPLIDVLLVLLIIFLMAMPIMMKMEKLQIPREILNNERPDPNASLLTVRVKADLEIVFNDGDKDETIQPGELASTLAPKLKSIHTGTEKVVFVDFDDAVPWNAVVSTMDTIRSLAADKDNHDEIKVALKVREDASKQQQQ